MAIHQYRNQPSTTLSGGVTAGASAISVASGADFPPQGKFTIIVDSEIMLVTGVTGTTWTVVRGHDNTAAAAHNNNATVTQILTVDSFLNAKHVDVRAYGAKGDGSTDDQAAIQAAIDDAPADATIFLPPATFVVATALTFTKPFHLVGHGATLKAGADALTNWINVSNTDNWSIEGVYFDDALRGQTVINTNTCRNIRITGCRFSNYSAEFGHSPSDSAIRLLFTENAIIANNTFDNFGQQYADSGTSPDTLNRCISLSESCQDIVIEGNLFSNVNTGIVASGTGGLDRLVVTGNSFLNVRDNAMYLLPGIGGAVITGNSFVRTNGTDFDEGIVLVGVENAVIAGNLFNEIRNKAIAYEQACRGLNIVGNIFVKEETDVAQGGNAIASRDAADTLTNAIIANNTVYGAHYGNQVMSLRGLSHVIIQGNRLATPLPAVGDSLIRIFGDNNNVLIRDNIFRNTGAAATDKYGVRLDTVTSFAESSIADNWYVGCVSNRGTIDNIAMRGEAVISVGSTRTQTARTKVLWGDGAPTAGNWGVGDIVYALTPTASGFIGWVCVTAGTPGTWKTFGPISA